MEPQLCLRYLRLTPHTKYVRTILAKSVSSRPTLFCVVSQSQRQVNGQFSQALNQRRHAHSKRQVSTTAAMPHTLDSVHPDEEVPATTSMSCLPLSTLIRSYLITSISSIPILLRPSLTIMTFLANSKSRLLNPDANPLLKLMLKRTFYVQFCAGETPAEVRQTIDGLKTMGYKGVILGHAREVVLSKDEHAQLDESVDRQHELNLGEITDWKNNTLSTIELAQKEDFVALKFTGAGRQVLQHLKVTSPCAPAFEAAMHEICQLATKRGINLLFDAEQASLQQAIDNWTIYFMKHYNKERAVVHGTYQMYAKRSPGLLAQHLAEAQKHNFVIGVKLVRGAYLGSDPRHLFWDTIEDTHKCYDNAAACLMERQYGGSLQPVSSDSTQFPRVSLVLASHNAKSVAAARKLRDFQASTGQERIPLAYGQLMGMADNVSCDIVQEARARQQVEKASTEVPQAYKYLVWGTMGECMKYLLRRAQENKDAVSRTIEARQALGHELARRMRISR